MFKIKRPMIFAVVSALVALGCAFYLWQERYFVRFVPIPLSSMDVLYERDGLWPIVTPLAPSGDFEFPTYDLTDEKQLRLALNALQGVSPVTSSLGSMDMFDGMTFDDWMSQVRTRPFQCTDATMLFMLAAMKQNLLVRQWWLLDEAWTPGNGHSIAEFYNPKTDRWVLVDAQHAAIIRDRNGDILDMRALLRLYHSGRQDDVVIDYGPFADAIRAGSRGPTTEDYFFKHKGLDTAVLIFRPPTWFAVAKINDPVIGYPIYTSVTDHTPRIVLTKLIALLLLLSGLTAVYGFVASVKRG